MFGWANFSPHLQMRPDQIHLTAFIKHSANQNAQIVYLNESVTETQTGQIRNKQKSFVWL